MRKRRRRARQLQYRSEVASDRSSGCDRDDRMRGGGKELPASCHRRSQRHLETETSGRRDPITGRKEPVYAGDGREVRDHRRDGDVERADPRPKTCTRS